jgi:hypothetical protein
MFHEGARRIAASGAHVPAFCDGDPSRVALEAYPGLLVRKQLGIRASYKSDTRREQTAARKAARKEILAELKAGRPLGIRVDLTDSFQKSLLEDGSGDLIDSLICAVQSAWASTRPCFGLPPEAFSGEGWIVSA